MAGGVRLAAATVVAAAVVSGVPWAASAADDAFRITDDRITESSGLALSRAHPHTVGLVVAQHHHIPGRAQQRVGLVQAGLDVDGRAGDQTKLGKAPVEQAIGAGGTPRQLRHAGHRVAAGQRVQQQPLMGPRPLADILERGANLGLGADAQHEPIRRHSV